MIACRVVFWLSLSFGGPFHLRLWGVMYPARVRGRVLGFIGMGRAAATRARRAGRRPHRRPTRWPTGHRARRRRRGRLCRRLRAASAPRRPEPPARSPPAGRSAPCASARSSAEVALAQGFYGGGLIAAAPLFALVHVDRLELSLGRRRRHRHPQRRWPRPSPSRSGAPSPTGSAALVGDAHRRRARRALARRLRARPGRRRAVGRRRRSAASPARRSMSASPRSSATRRRSPTRSAAMAGWNALTGARGIVAAFLMSALVQLGLVDVTTGLLLCAAASLVGVAPVRADPAGRPGRDPGLGDPSGAPARGRRRAA